MQDETSKTAISARKFRFMQVFTAFLFATSSILITIVNKNVLTVYNFPSMQIIGIGQMLFGITTIYILNCFGKVILPDLTLSTVKKIMPLPILYFANLFTGLGSTQQLSLPMLTALRRISIMMTLMGEAVILGATFPKLVYVSVVMMILGATVAALNDLAFSLSGYTWVMANNVCTALYGVTIKQKLDTKELDKTALIFYNSFLMVLPASLYALVDQQYELAAAEFTQWSDAWFLASFVGSCGMGFVLMYSTMLCTQYNSPLLTAMVGCMKNVFISYIGLVFGGDYVFSWENFYGLTIGVVGSLVYTYANVRRSTQPIVASREQTSQV